jgi:hypothetical protein
MTRGEAWALLVEMSQRWVDDPDSSVEWAGEYEGRWGVRMGQEARDFTTVWFDVGDRTVGIEALLVPAPVHDAAAVYRYCLARNRTAWRVHLALDREGSLVITGRVGLPGLDSEVLDEVLGAVYELVETAFPVALRTGFIGREKTS